VPVDFGLREMGAGARWGMGGGGGRGGEGGGGGGLAIGTQWLLIKSTGCADGIRTSEIPRSRSASIQRQTHATACVRCGGCVTGAPKPPRPVRV
jgi:hypothetical protein